MFGGRYYLEDVLGTFGNILGYDRTNRMQFVCRTKLLTPLFGMDMPRMSAFFKVSWQRQSTGDVSSFIC